MKRRRAAQPGQALVWVAAMLPCFLAIMGLATDGGLVFEQRRELQALADGAARAGANELDPAAYRQANTVALDPVAARATARIYLEQADATMSGEVDADRSRVVIRVWRDVPTTFLRIVRIDSVRIAATSSAELRHGISQGTP